MLLSVSEMHVLSKRAQCLANIQGVLTSLGAPELVVKRVDLDRVFFEPSEDFLKWVEEARDDNGCPRFKEDQPNEKLHPGATAGWREDVTLCSLQICVLPDSIEVDIDLGGTRTDLVGAITHVAEVIAPGKTNHLKVRKMLAKHRDLKIDEVTNVEMAALLKKDTGNKEIEFA